MLGFNALAATIYDDNASYNGNSFSMTNGQSFGNEISLTPNVWTLTNFTIEYYAPSSLASTIGLDIRFYQNDGTPENGFPTPGTLFYDSGWYFGIGGGGLPGSGFQVVTYNTSTLDFSSGALVPLTITLPGDFTFVVTYTNTAGSSLSSLQSPLANDQAGISYGDYWVENSGVWTLRTNSISAANLVVDFGGTVPEPSVFGLGAIGGALLFGINKLRRKS